jgi:anti-sigma factor RsiW
MSDPGTPISEEELHAFVDGRLVQDRQPHVLRYLQDHADVALRVAAFRAQREALRAALGPVAAEPVPPRLDLQLLIQQRLAQRRFPWRAAAAVLLAFVLGGAGGWFVRFGAPQPTLTISLLSQLSEQAVANHMVYTADQKRPTELGADQRDDLARWVTNRLKHKVAPPDLAGDGYSYIGGRLAATPDGPAGLFMYDGKQGVRLTVFVLPLSDAKNSPMQHVESAKVDGIAWIEKGIGYTVVGKLPQEELRHLAEQVRQQLSVT